MKLVGSKSYFSTYVYILITRDIKLHSVEKIYNRPPHAACWRAGTSSTNRQSGTGTLPEANTAIGN